MTPKNFVQLALCRTVIRSLFAHIETLFQQSNSKHILTNYITYHTHIQKKHNDIIQWERSTLSKWNQSTCRYLNMLFSHKMLIHL